MNKKELVEIDRNVLVTLFIGIAITALIGGFFLGLFREDAKDEGNPSNENSLPVHDYAGVLDENEERQKNSTENEDNSNENSEEENIVEQGKQKTSEESKVAKDQVESTEKDDDEYEKGEDIFDIYEGKYSKNVIEKSIETTYKASYLLFDNGGELEDWETFSTDRLIESLLSGEKDTLVFDVELFGVSVVPLESDYKGIAVGGYAETLEGVALIEFDYQVNDNEVLLDDIKLLWGN